jgi:hypothetical protein
MSKRDDVLKLYEPSKLINNITNILFYVNTIAAFFTIKSAVPIKECLIKLQILIAFSHVFFYILDDTLFWYNAESKRRKSLIENSFKIDVTGLETEKYYNNNMQPSLQKYFVNTFESLFFSKNIAKQMIPTKIINVFCALIIFIVSCIEVQKGETVLLIAQTIFSGKYIDGSISLFCYYSRLNILYDEFYRQLITIKAKTKQKQIACLLIASTEYESIKAYYKIRLSEKIFLKQNKLLSSEWESIETKIQQ